MLYSYTHMATVGVKGLNTAIRDRDVQKRKASRVHVNFG